MSDTMQTAKPNEPKTRDYGTLFSNVSESWISNEIPCKVWDKITYQFPNVNGCPLKFGNDDLELAF